MGGMEKRGGRSGGGSKNRKELFRAPKITTRHLYHTTRPRRCPSRKADQFTLASGDTVHGYFLSVAIYKPVQ